MKIVKICLSIFALLVFSGCSCKYVPLVACEIEYKDRPVEVKVPVKCATPDTFCSKEGSLQGGTIGELLGCIYELRESNKVCK